MNKNMLIGKDVVSVDTNGTFYKFFNWEWWRANGLATREVYSDGTVITYHQYKNQDGDILHLDGFTRYKVKIEREVIG